MGERGFLLSSGRRFGLHFLGGRAYGRSSASLGTKRSWVAASLAFAFVFCFGVWPRFAPSGGFDKFILMGTMMLLANGSRQCVTAVKDWLGRQNWIRCACCRF